MLEANASNVSSFIALRNPEASPARLPAWQKIIDCVTRMRGTSISTLFDAEEQRFDTLSLRVNGLLADFSRQLVDQHLLSMLFDLARQTHLELAIKAVFAGDHLNFTENRAVLHMAMRDFSLVPQSERTTISENDTRLRRFAEAVRQGRQLGATGKPFDRVINLGIGGSDLGPRLVHHALGSHVDGVDVRFVANVDPAELASALDGANPETTLFIISSKSFATPETLSNALAAREWVGSFLGEGVSVSAHFAAVSNAVDSATEFGIRADQLFALPEWVGGRYSLWSAIGLPLLISLGDSTVDALHAGARAMDQHFATSPIAHNLPVRMALLGLWNTSFLDIESLALLPYAHGLQHLPAWLQQLEMESNGKHCLHDGSTSQCQTSPIVWGGTGTNGQHAFHQLLYQGTRRVALDFITIAPGDDAREQALFESALAQAAALAKGRDLATARATLNANGSDHDQVDKLAPHLVCRGNQPSTTLMLPKLDAFQLGQLLALYEHKIFVQGWIWGINSFDQYGVELGKEMARALNSGDQIIDIATRRLLEAAQGCKA